MHGLTGPLSVSASFNCNFFAVNIKISWFGGPVTAEISWSCPKITGPGPTDKWLTKHLESLDPWLSTECPVKTDQTLWMYSLVQVFVECTS